MNILPIPSSLCPYCRGDEGECSIIVSEVETLASYGLKSNEADFLTELKNSVYGRKTYTSREGYFAHKYVCSRKH